MRKLLLAIPVLFVSCTKSFKEELPNAPDQLVLNSLLNAGDSLNIISLSKTNSFLTSNRPPLLADGFIEWSINGAPFGPITPCDSSQGEPYAHYCNTQALREGDIIEVKANYPGFEELYARTQIPDSPQIENIRLENSDPFMATHTLYFDIQSDTRKKEYFIVEVFSQTTNFFGQSLHEVQLTTKDVTLEMLGVSSELIDLPIDDPIGLKCFFTNELFNGSSKTIQFSLTQTVIGGGFSVDKLFLFVTKCSPSYYEYQRSKLLNRLTDSNPFKIPVQYHSNVKNGIGVIAGYNLKIEALN